MSKLFLLFIVSIYLIACSSEKKCDFSSLNSAVDCSCDLLDQKASAKGNSEKLEELKKITKSMDESFDEAIDKGTFTEEEFTAKLKSDCPSFSKE
ncbi:MAG: hypothetical protein H6598_02355 [Flavobacteriales bacterium]|nr:hypothetical protein [Flavobacteriales bacterium]